MKTIKTAKYKELKKQAVVGDKLHNYYHGDDDYTDVKDEANRRDRGSQGNGSVCSSCGYRMMGEKTCKHCGGK